MFSRLVELENTFPFERQASNFRGIPSLERSILLFLLLKDRWKNGFSSPIPTFGSYYLQTPIFRQRT